MSRDPDPPAERRTSRNAVPRPAVAHDPQMAAAVLCQRLGYFFRDAELLSTALTHPSWRNEHAPGGTDNQRLEFLGDAVLGLIITQELVERLPERREGALTVLKSQLVRATSLARLADELGLGPAMRLGRGEDLTGGRERPSVLADALEAVLGAVFLDAGYEQVHEVVLRLFADAMAEVIAQVESVGEAGTPLSATTANWKTAVQELLQQFGAQPPGYELVGEEGPVHARHFRVRATSRFGRRVLTAEGEGSSKKSAEHEAAAELYRVVTALIPAGSGDRAGPGATAEHGAAEGPAVES